MHPSTRSFRKPAAARALARVLACAAVVAASGVVTTAAPAQTVFSDRAAFLAVLVSPMTFAAPVPTPCPTEEYCQPNRLFAIGPLSLTSGAIWIKPLALGTPYAFGWEPDGASGPPGLPGPGDAPYTVLQSPVPLYALGFDYGAVLLPPPPVATADFVVTLGNGETFVRTTLPGSVGSPLLGTVQYQFFGVISPTPFTTFEIYARSMEGVGVVNGARYNNVTIAAVPEPGTLGLLIGGVVMLGVAVRQRRGTRA
jgi:hypothetical protein